ncbi:LytTR family DNA-binding domain-containing protein [Sphingobacterium oryzagri]|uniref:LytTR family DNA-binding domain-containing protein n=1 Tax=Sphingobacterium oryzagri TaxID=3025669 RepID=A0ABY7WPB0_9SPHI|nr:LytTR family DNA-binding domain-containing protein [Sphingobacterium sp. KACC 22765]WDF70258.1 LytTR family DNA-binding domain-containing protein [Sphingobacterium sp. KACC 22765]
MIRCLLIDDEKIANDLLLSKLTKISFVEVVGVFDNAFDALRVLDSAKVDLVFCDIQMPDITGVNFYKSLKNPPLFAFITGNPDFALEGYELDILDYIVKPYSMDRILKTLRKAQTVIRHRAANYIENQDNLIIRDRSHIAIIPYNDVFFIKADKDYVWIETLEKQYHIWKRLIDMEDILKSAQQFIRIHKSYIVNLNFARRIEGNTIKMKGSIQDIAIGGQYRTALLKKLGLSSTE